MDKNLMDKKIFIEFGEKYENEDFKGAMMTINAAKTMLLSSHEYKSWSNMMVPKGSKDTIYFYPITLDIALIDTAIEHSFLWKKNDAATIFDVVKAQMDKIMRNQLPFIVSEKEPDTNPDSEFFKTYCDNQSIDQLYNIISIFDEIQRKCGILYEDPFDVLELLTGKPVYHFDRIWYVLLTFIEKKVRERELKFFKSKWNGYAYAISRYDVDSGNDPTALMQLLGVVPDYHVVSRSAKEDIINIIKDMWPANHSTNINTTSINVINELNKIYNHLIDHDYIWID